MRNICLVLIVVIMLGSTPLAVGDCGCTLPDENHSTEGITQPWLSELQISQLQEEGRKQGWTFTIGTNPATERPFSELCGLVEPENWSMNASFDPCTPTGTLPSRFDWRELEGCTPIRNQGGCGSCWAFGTIAPLECNILIYDHDEVDLSEQWLVSCNTNGWGCDGGWWAHDFLQWKMDRCNGTGAVLEKDFPYRAEDLPCDGPYDHPYLIDSWHYIGFSQGIAPTEAIKQAIMTYGPVSVGCAVTPAFGGYTGGVFNEDDPQASINHAVALVGWDDTQGTEGVWFLRNSWGPGWGEDGYMRIEYKVCKVGYAACYVKYPVKTKIEITGGMFGARIGVRNVGNTATTNLCCTFSMKGGVFRGVNTSFVDTIDSLEPGMVVYERIPWFGFGPVQLQVTVIPDNAGKTAQHAEGMLCGLFLFVLRN
jgi:C1A family cysteine protease